MHDETPVELYGLQQDEWAIVWSPAFGYRIVMPDREPDTQVPEDGLILTAMMMRIQSDFQFRQECLDWIKAQ